MEYLWRQGRYHPPTMAAYVQAVARSLSQLRPDIIVHRLNADPQPGELLSPGWAADKHEVLKALHKQLECGIAGHDRENTFRPADHGC